MASSTSTQRPPNGPIAPPKPSPAADRGVGLPDVTPRLASLSRRRRPAVWGLGLALVCVGAALAAVMTLAAGGRVAVLSVVRPVAAGEAVTNADLGVARVPTDPQLDPIPAAERQSVVGRLADVDLRQGTLLTRNQLTSVAIPGPGQAVVGVPLRPGQLPARPLRPGDKILVIETPGPGATATSQAPSVEPVRGAVVVATGPPGADGSVVVDLVVSEDDSIALAGAAAAGRLSLVLLPRGG
jgi:hypothetical protein